MNLFKKHRSFFAYFSFSIGTSALGFIAALAMMRLMPPEEYGRIALFLSMQFIAVPMVSFAADNLIATNKAKLDVLEYDHFRRSYITFSYLMFVVVMFTFFMLFLLDVLHDPLFMLIPIYGLVRFLIGVASIEYVMESKSVQYGLLAFSTSFISLLFTVLFLSVISDVADWRIAALFIADVLFLFVRYRGRLNLLWTFSFDKKIFKDVMRFGFPLLLSVAPAWALNESDKFIVAKYVDMASLGYYAAACAIGGIMVTFNTAMLNAMVPKIYKALGEDPKEMMSVIKRYVRRFLGASAIFGCFYILIYGFAADFVLPMKYSEARQIVYVIILFSLGKSLYAVLGLVTDYYSMTVVKLKGILYGGVTTVIVVIIGVMKFGVIGAAIGVGTGYLVLSFVLWFYLVKKSKQFSATADFVKLI